MSFLYYNRQELDCLQGDMTSDIKAVTFDSTYTGLPVKKKFRKILFFDKKGKKSKLY